MKKTRDPIRLRSLFTGWEAKERIVTPIITNLLSAFLLFLAAWAFRDPIRQIFNPTVPDYPLHCVLEPYNPPKADGTPDENKVAIDLYIINLTPDIVREEDLRKVVASNSDFQDLDYNIQLRMNSGSMGEIESVNEEKDFNEGGKTIEQRKGIIVIKHDAKSAVIVVREIREWAMMKVKIVTTEPRYIGSRANFKSLPITVSYPGRK